MNLILKRIESVVLLITSPFVMVLLPRKDRCNDGNDLAPGAVEYLDAISSSYRSVT